MRRDGISFLEAYRRLKSYGNCVPPVSRQESVPENIPLRSPTWEKRGFAFVEECEEDLWSASGNETRRYLNERGLSDETIHRYRLGFQPVEKLYEPLETWGIPVPEDGNRHAVRLPDGIVIPCFADGRLWSIKIRRSYRICQFVDESKRYVKAVYKKEYTKIKGSQPSIFGAANLRNKRIAVFTEGELDCMLLSQFVSDQIGVATLGSASDRTENLDQSIWEQYLGSDEYILVVFDRDEAGEKGAQAMQGFSDRVIRVHLPAIEGVKDITDFWKSGGDLSDWITRTIEHLGLL